jgi:hypothetical protein
MNGGTEPKDSSQIQRSFIICAYNVNYNTAQQLTNSTKHLGLYFNLLGRTDNTLCMHVLLTYGD